MKKSKEQKEADKLARQKAKQLQKEVAQIESEKNQKPVKSITITIEWKKSRTWGSNPNCEAAVSFKDGTFEHSPIYKCSGCGYDKKSTVIADVFNNYLKYKLYDPKLVKKSDPPYGFYIKEGWKHYNGGVGTSCYHRISEFIGGKFENVASGKTFDVFQYTDNK